MVEWRKVQARRAAVERALGGVGAAEPAAAPVVDAPQVDVPQVDARDRAPRVRSL
jgi:hypothetical protein